MPSRSALACLFLISVACGDKEQPASITLSAELSGDFATSQVAPPGTSFLATGAPDKVVAVPHFRGSVGGYERDLIKEVAVVPGESFDIELDTDTDWVLFLVDSDAPIEERICSYLTIPSSDDRLVDMPITEAQSDVELGRLELGTDGDAQTEHDTSTLSNSFSLSESDLESMSQLDESFRQVANSFLNYDVDRGVYYEGNLTVGFAADLATLVDADPRDYAFSSMGIGIGTNDPALTSKLDDLCTGSVPFRLQPTRIVYEVNGEKQSTTFPLSASGMTSDENGCFNSILGLHRFDDGSLYIQTQLTITDISEGYWTVETRPTATSAETIVHAAFDFEQSAPIDTDYSVSSYPFKYPTVPVPVPRIERDRDGRLLSAKVEWYRYDPGAHEYVLIDPAVLDLLVASSALVLSEEDGYGEVISNDDRSLLVDAPIVERWQLLPNSPQARVHQVHQVSVQYSMGGNEHSFIWTQDPFCGNRQKEGDEQCDRDGRIGESCETLGYGPGEMACSSNCTYDARFCESGLSWQAQAVQPMTVERVGHRMTLLDNGEVLITGGIDQSGAALSSAELYDPTTQTFRPTGSMSEARDEHSSTLLSDGRVMVAGATGVDLYDPVSGLFARVAELQTPRKDHAAIYVPETNDILFLGGELYSEGFPVATASGEWFHSTTGTPLELPFSMRHPRKEFTAHRLSNGSIIAIGGRDGGNNALKSIELGEVGGSMEVAAEMENYRIRHESVILPDGSVLIVGGIGGSYSSSRSPIPFAETFFEGGRYEVGLYENRMPSLKNHSVVRLPSGHVFMAGSNLINRDCGDEICTFLTIAYPEARTVVKSNVDRPGQLDGSLVYDHQHHEAIVLQDGSVLITGGYDGRFLPEKRTSNAEIVTFTEN